MKTQRIKKTLLVAAAAGFVWFAWKAQAQDTGAASSLPNGVAQIIQLEQAKMSDDTIIAYIKSTANTYNLDADQILFLRRQGVSDAVITAMLSQAKAAPASALVAATPPPAAVYASTVVPAATVTCVQPAPVSYFYPYNYYPSGYYYYGWPRPLLHPWVGVRWGWRGGWHVGVAF